MKLRYTLPILLMLLIWSGYVLVQRQAPTQVEYGVTFSAKYAEELGLDPMAVYESLLDDLHVKRLRIPVYWPRVETQKGSYSWNEIDEQLKLAKLHDASVILAIGRRVPRWPECHVPDWAAKESWSEQKADIRDLLRAEVTRYRNDPTVTMWQVENEPLFDVFASEFCGSVDKAFLDEEIALVHSLDSRPVMTTDSGNLGSWVGAYRRADVFGTSEYLYFWNATLGSFRTVLPPQYYRAKANVMRFFFGDKPVLLSELSLEPWFGAPFNDVSLEEQLSRLNIERFHEILQYAKDSRLNPQYLWGVEWWYYMKEKAGHPEFWEAAKQLFK